jgi:surfeit locus 1 family protein
VTGRLRPLLWPGVMTVAMLALLLGLGTWQVQRLHLKRGLLAQIAHAEAAPAVRMPADPEPFTKVELTGRLRDDLSATYGAEVRDMRSGPELGTHLIVPLEHGDGDVVLVDRGWVPESRPHAIALPSGEVTVDGYVRPGDTPGPFSARDSPATRQFYTLDPAAIGAALGLRRVAPFILVAMGPTPPERYPDPARHLPQPPNNHLSYAITWYGLAVALVVIFVLWARKVLTA